MLHLIKNSRECNPPFKLPNIRITMRIQRTTAKASQSGNAVPRSRLFLISNVYLPKARSIFLLKCSLRSLIESTSFSSRNVLLLLNALRFSSLSLSSCTILSILSSEVFGAYNEGKTIPYTITH